MPPALAQSAWLRFSGFFLFYFAQGVPIGLLSVAVPVWLAERGASVATLAVYTSVVTLPWAGKLLVGPVMDRFGFAPMGFRRPWVILAQGGLALSFLALAAVGASVIDSPVDDRALMPLMAAGFAVNVFAASQDVAVDGMAIDLLPIGERGRANAIMACGQVVGYSSYGYLCTVLLTRYGMVVAALWCFVTVVGVFAFATAVRERPGERLLPWTAGAAAPRDGLDPKAGGSTFVMARQLARALLLPMSLVLIAVEFANRARDAVALAVFPKFAIELGYTAEQYATFTAWSGFGAALVGVALGPLIDRAGARRILFGALFAGAGCHFVAGLAPTIWHHAGFLVALASAGAVATQLVFVGIIALFMSLCWSRVAATQFAVYMSLANLSRSVGGWAFAPLADELSYEQDFLIMGALLLAATALLTLFNPAAHAKRLESLQRAAESSPTNQIARGRGRSAMNKSAGGTGG